MFSLKSSTSKMQLFLGNHSKHCSRGVKHCAKSNPQSPKHLKTQQKNLSFQVMVQIIFKNAWSVTNESNVFVERFEQIISLLCRASRPREGDLALKGRNPTVVVQDVKSSWRFLMQITIYSIQKFKQPPFLLSRFYNWREVEWAKDVRNPNTS